MKGNFSHDESELFLIFKFTVFDKETDMCMQYDDVDKPFAIMVEHLE